MANSGVLKTYDPKKVSVTFGSIVFTDFAEGSFIEITGEDNFESVEGADGSENRINKNKNGKDVNITLSQASITNDALTAAFLVDKNNNNGIKPLTIKDLNGTTLFFSSQSYIKKEPDMTFSDSLETRQWNFRAPQATITVGGNL